MTITSNMDGRSTLWRNFFDPILETNNLIKLDKITDVSTFILNLNNKIKHFLCYLFIS